MIRFVDLFAGIGGIRLGFEQACRAAGHEAKCVLTSEIKPHAINVLRANHPDEPIVGDVACIDAAAIEDFDFLLAGFPCQAFSAAGKRLGFLDTRGTLFFEVERILCEKRPFGFILENVEGLVNHDKVDRKASIGRTLQTILDKLAELGYAVSWRVLNAKDFGLAQERKRIYIVGTRTQQPSLEHFTTRSTTLEEVLERGLPTVESDFTRRLLRYFSPAELYGKSIKDKRGGKDNIHSWDIALRGEISDTQKTLLNALFRERRRKVWAEQIGVAWMDGMPLNKQQIASFFPSENLEAQLEDLVEKGYLKKEYPKALIDEPTPSGVQRVRKQDCSKPIGYNIVAGKLSFEISKILHPRGLAPTLVAMDMRKNYVVDNGGLRPLTLREGLRLFGYPERFRFPVTASEGYDLLGNTVAVPVVKAVAERVVALYVNLKPQG